MPKEATALQSREAWALPAPGPGMGSTRAIKGGLQRPQAFFRQTWNLPKPAFQMKGLEFARGKSSPGSSQILRNQIQKNKQAP